jgi:anti-anti-sigma factor
VLNCSEGGDLLSFTDTVDEKNAIVRLNGELTAGNSDPLRSRLKALIAEGAKNIVMDLEGVGAIDSSGIGLLAATFNSISKNRGTYKVTGLSNDMYQFFVNLRLNVHFPIEKASHQGAA